MFNLYRKSQNVQYQWIRKHPVIWVTSNVAIAAALIGFLEYKERQEKRKAQNQTTQQES